MLKTKLLFLLAVICFIFIFGKLFLIQVFNTQGYSGDYLKTRKIYPARGRILDIHRQPLATNQTTYLVYAEPKNIDNLRYLVKDLDSVLHIGEATLEAKLDPKKDWVRISSGVSKENKDALIKLNIKGIGLQEEPARYYPESSLSAHLVGFVGKDSEGENVGYFGIEGFYDKELGGFPGLVKSERDLIGRPIFLGTQQRVDPQNGDDLVLTIDNAIQTIVKKKLLKGVEIYKPKNACAIIADPNTMAILSLVCLPDFDPDKYYDFGEEFYKNPVISNVYEPGSTFKPLVVAAALEEKVIKPNETYDEDGPVTVGGYTIRTWNDKYAGEISITQILERSSNVGMVYIGGKLGEEKLYKYIQKYRFGKTTDVDLQGETASSIKPRNQWYEIDYSTATFGQGIAVTPIQMIRAFSSLINGGKLLQPYVVNSIISSGTEHVREPKIIERVISEKSSQIMRKMLISTVNYGEVKYLKPEGYNIGGKTGTAQIAIQGHYDSSKTIASFIGFAPADNPKFIGLVIFDQPEASQWGSETAAPVFFDIAKDLFLYYNIAPEQAK